jgi:hypothetical protein
LRENKLQPGKFDVCVTTYEIAIKEKSALNKFSWRCIIFYFIFIYFSVFYYLHIYILIPKTCLFTQQQIVCVLDIAIQPLCAKIVSFELRELISGEGLCLLEIQAKVRTNSF